MASRVIMKHARSGKPSHRLAITASSAGAVILMALASSGALAVTVSSAVADPVSSSTTPDVTSMRRFGSPARHAVPATRTASTANDGYWQLGDDQDIGANLIKQAQEQTDRITKDKADAEARKRADDAAKAAADEAARQLALAQQSAAASRSAARDDESASLNARLSAKPFDIKSVMAAPPLSADQAARGQQIVAYALQFIGRPYVWGGTSPVSGWDCSGYVQYVYRNFGIQLPRVSGDQAAGGVHVAQSAAQPGDVIANDIHAAIYIGNGMVVNAANPWMGTIVSPLSSFPGSFTVTRYY